MLFRSTQHRRMSRRCLVPHGRACVLNTRSRCASAAQVVVRMASCTGSGAHLVLQRTCVCVHWGFGVGVQVCFVVGNETTGVPAEIAHTTTNIVIPMPGAGFCLNTSQAANIVVYEAVKQMGGI